MKIAIVLPPNFRFDLERPNSIETVVRTLNAESRYRGEITVLADAGAADHGDFNVVTLDPAGGRHCRTDRAVKALREIQPDLLELHQHAPSAGRIARSFLGTFSVFYRHNFQRNPAGLFQRLRHKWRNRPFDAHIFVSQAARTAFIADFPEFDRQSFAMQNAIPLAPWIGNPEPRETLISYAGRAAPEKGFAELCTALTEVLDAYPDWRAELLASDWDVHGNWAARQAAPLDRFGDRVLIRRDQPIAEVQALLKRAAIAVVPSKWQEPFGLAAIEAHAGGCAVVSSGSGGLREASGDHAVFVDPITGPGLREAIAGLITDPAARLRLARAGQKFVRTTHDAAKRTVELDDLRERLMARREPA